MSHNSRTIPQASIPVGVTDAGVLRPEESYECWATKMYNVLMIGDSRTGKTTFINMIKSLEHTVSFELYRGTALPENHNFVVKYQDELLSINFLDTPGLNEASASEIMRSNNLIFDIIGTFVKRDITKINLIIIAVNAAHGLNATQIKTITEVLSFFGYKFRKNMALLVTHAENVEPNEEEKIKKEFGTGPLKNLYRNCDAGLLFTGALSKGQFDDQRIRDKFMRVQKIRIAKFLKILVNTPSEPLNVAKIEEISGRFRSLESVYKDYQTAVCLGPENKDLKKRIIENRVVMQALLDNSTRLKQEDNQELLEDLNKTVQECAAVSMQDEEPNISSEAKLKLAAQLVEAARVGSEVEKLREVNEELTVLFNNSQAVMHQLQFMSFV